MIMMETYQAAIFAYTIHEDLTQFQKRAAKSIQAMSSQLKALTHLA